MIAQKKFVNNLPSKFWIYRFFKKQLDLARRMPENLSHQRRNVSRAQIRQWFTDLENELLEEHQINASELLPKNSSRMFNLDKTEFQLAGILGRLKIIASKGIKNVYRILGCGNYQKPLVIFPGAQPRYYLDHVNPSDGSYNSSDSLTEMFTFLRCLKKSPPLKNCSVFIQMP
ncbi:uncharacterized protein LOC124814600 [Hydra vulgaris]|uniref:uncharacterized protein LOC124814600 n=1 Tax=Hydra vulgaris TaxID=6087 RepID=UPI001F5E8DB2|nr:uncharacterized protein LOC124814600 [Hydra vulgaris]